MNDKTQSIVSYASYDQGPNLSNRTVLYTQPVGLRNSSTMWRLTRTNSSTFRYVLVTCNIYITFSGHTMSYRIEEPKYNLFLTAWPSSQSHPSAPVSEAYESNKNGAFKL
jgi:hypothetical protein